MSRFEEEPVGGRDLAARVGQSIAAIERAVGNVAACRDSMQHYKDLSEDLARQIDDGDRERRELKRLLADAEHAVFTERARAADADRHAADLEATIRQLEDQIEAIQSQTEQLVDAAMHLLSTDAADGEGSASLRRKFAA